MDDLIVFVFPAFVIIILAIAYKANKSSMPKKEQEFNNEINAKTNRFKEQFEPGEDGIVLYQGEYIIGVDLKPGRYSFKLIAGNDGRIETTGKNWFYKTLGSEWNGISEYKNLTLKLNQKLKIHGNVKLLFTEEGPINIEEDINIIKQKDEEIKKLKSELYKVKKELLEIKEEINSKYLEENLIMTTGVYIGGENIKTGYYDLKVISGNGYVTSLNRNIYVKMGTENDESMEYRGLRFNSRTRIEVTGNLVLKATYKNIKI